MRFHGWVQGEGGRGRWDADLLEDQTVAVEGHDVLDVGNETEGGLPIGCGVREGKPDRDFVLGRLLDGGDAGDREDESRPVDVDADASGETATGVVRWREGKPET